MYQIQILKIRHAENWIIISVKAWLAQLRGNSRQCSYRTEPRVITLSCSDGGSTSRNKSDGTEKRYVICDVCEWLHIHCITHLASIFNLRYGNIAYLCLEINVGLVPQTQVINWSGIQIWWWERHIWAMSGHNVTRREGKDHCQSTYLAKSTKFCHWTFTPEKINQLDLKGKYSNIYDEGAIMLVGE